MAVIEHKSDTTRVALLLNITEHYRAATKNTPLLRKQHARSNEYKRTTATRNTHHSHPLSPLSVSNVFSCSPHTHARTRHASILSRNSHPCPSLCRYRCPITACCHSLPQRACACQLHDCFELAGRTCTFWACCCLTVAADGVRGALGCRLWSAKASPSLQVLLVIVLCYVVITNGGDL